MAILSNPRPTLADWAQVHDPNGRVGTAINLLSQTNGIIEDMVMLEGNMTTGHKSSQITGLPSIIARRIYQGVPPSKAGRVQVVDSAANFEGRSEVDKLLVDMSADPAAYRMQEAMPFLESLNQTVAETAIYGSTAVNPEYFDGLAPRYSTVDPAVPISRNVIDAGGTGTDNTSIWLVSWGPTATFGFFPKNTQAGIEHEDLGVIDLYDNDGNPYRGYAEIWRWLVGMAVVDWRRNVRIANIDVSDLRDDFQGTTSRLLELMIRAVHTLPSTEGIGARPVFYVSRTVRAQLDIMAMNRSSNALSLKEASGQFSTSFMGIPIKTLDVMSLAEDRVV